MMFDDGDSFIFDPRGIPTYLLTSYVLGRAAWLVGADDHDEESCEGPGP